MEHSMMQLARSEHIDGDANWSRENLHTVSFVMARWSNASNLSFVHCDLCLQVMEHDNVEMQLARSKFNTMMEMTSGAGIHSKLSLSWQGGQMPAICHWCLAICP